MCLCISYFLIPPTLCSSHRECGTQSSLVCFLLSPIFGIDLFYSTLLGKLLCLCCRQQAWHGLPGLGVLSVSDHPYVRAHSYACSYALLWDNFHENKNHLNLFAAVSITSWLKAFQLIPTEEWMKKHLPPGLCRTPFPLLHPLLFLWLVLICALCLCWHSFLLRSHWERCSSQILYDTEPFTQAHHSLCTGITAFHQLWTENSLRTELCLNYHGVPINYSCA